METLEWFLTVPCWACRHRLGVFSGILLTSSAIGAPLKDPGDKVYDLAGTINSAPHPKLWNISGLNDSISSKIDAKVKDPVVLVPSAIPDTLETCHFFSFVRGGAQQGKNRSRLAYRIKAEFEIFLSSFDEATRGI